MKIRQRFFGQSIVSIEQFTKDDLETVFELATFYKQGQRFSSRFTDLAGKIMAALFYEPSSRTLASFISAMQYLGGGIIPLNGMTYTSVAKGETLTDTIRVFQNYADIIVIRHPEKGAAKIASDYAKVPIINAGDGTGEHPTQALLDIYTIKERLGRIDNLKIAMVGDLKYGRTVHSLAKALSCYSGISIYLISPNTSPMPPEVVAKITRLGVKTKQRQSIEEIIDDVDVLYMTRVQKERMRPDIYEKIKNLFKLDNKLANKMKKEAIIMHPLPRVGEITWDVDQNPRAMYLRYQMKNGLFIRMALLKLILTK